MAKIKNPLLSGEARGGFGQAINFRMLAGAAVASKYRKNNTSKTAAQVVQREAYKAGCAAWASLTTSQKSAYKDRAKALLISGFNLFMREVLTMATPATPTSAAMRFNGQTLEILSNLGGVFNSVERSGTGLYVVKFTPPAGMVDNDYVVIASVVDDDAYPSMAYERGNADQRRTAGEFGLVAYGLGIGTHDFSRISVIMQWG